MSAADAMDVRFENRPARAVRGDIQLHGNISWGNKRTCERDACGTQQWAAPTAETRGHATRRETEERMQDVGPPRRAQAWLRTIHTSGHGLPNRVPATHRNEETDTSD